MPEYTTQVGVVVYYFISVTKSSGSFYCIETQLQTISQQALELKLHDTPAIDFKISHFLEILVKLNHWLYHNKN